eukprot:CAMPEP_0116130354 /NCGR_PEP_ID=MMETSP0329-20121206/8425_1 /TAXON_ID=697910 /ORGANISM="Pseudo-nitzschia arenysensis, Strain B593" /LENGTH=1905 /DNA_ID=CAMNT_0003624707 /DNA_START=271 /DNA_END=5988 /DNA_ORIENTATION=+
MPTKRKLSATKLKGSSGSSDIATLYKMSSPLSPIQSILLNRVGSSSVGTEGPLSLPLLEGLVHRPGVADGIVQDAFGRWKAGRLIARNIELKLKDRKTRLKRVGKTKKGSQKRSGPPPSKRRRRENKNASKLQHTEVTEQQQGLRDELEKRAHRQSPRDSGEIHWLFRSLSSPSVRERRVALKILALGCPMDGASIRTLIELVIFLIKKGNAFRTVDATCMVGWLTLLKFLLIRVLSGSERLAYCVSPDIGLTWLCRSLWAISSNFQKEGYPGAGTTRVCLSFVGIIHSLVLTGSDDAIYQVHKLLWKEPKHLKKSITDNGLLQISPLACLMGTYHLWAGSNEYRSMVDEKFLTMMKQLIDPSLLPKILSLPSGSSLDGDGKNDRRLASLLGKSNDSTSAAATNEKENSSKATKKRSASTTSTDSHFSNDTKAGGKESSSNNNTASSPGGNSAASSVMGSPSNGTERSMGASVARLFRSLYASNSENGGDDLDTVNHVQSGEDEDIVVDFHDDDNEIEDVLMHDPASTDEEDQDDEDDDDEDDDDDDDENDEAGEENEAAAGTGDEAFEKNNEANISNDEKENDDENDNASNNNDDDSDDNNINSEDDEEIDSDEGEDCEDCNSMIEMEEDDHDEDEIMIHEDELPQIEQGLLELQRNFNKRSTKSSSSAGQSSTSSVYPQASSGQGVKDRSQLYIKAAMEVLSLQHLPSSKSKSPQQQLLQENGPLSIASEKALMTSIMHIVKPEKKPLDGKIFLRRAPTQEEYLRNHSKDVISFSTLKPPSSGNDQEEPTVRDLRQHVANDLQMGDSAEMLEVLVANKILDVDLKLRVVLQTVWKEHLVQNSGGSSSSLSSLLGGGGRGGSRSFLSSSSGLSLMLYSSLERSMGSSGSGPLSITADTPAEDLPPMVMTYRLTGVDGEATEDTVSNLTDPEAPSESSSEAEIELMMEKEYGITRTVMARRGVFCLLRSVQSNITNTLQKIRRDGVGGAENHARNVFKQSFYPGLGLLVCCAKLPSNRKLFLQARAPTTLLRLLLDVLNALEDDESDKSSESNSTATALQELIEVLASDILSSNGDTSSDATEESESDEDASTLRLLIQAIKTSSLSRTLRNVIAKLVPYLTYGKKKLSRELASEFMIHVDSNQLGEYEVDDSSERRKSSEQNSILMDTFIHASISLPANEVCNSLRTELLKCGFVERILAHILRDCPKEPPSWSTALWSKEAEVTKQKQMSLEKKWKEFSKRAGLKTSFEILIGLSKEHLSTQSFLGAFEEGDLSFLQFCHWLESTSDNSSADITMKSFSLLAETLLDDIAEFGDASSDMVKRIKALRKKTRNRKKEIAMERRKKTLVSVNKFVAFAGATADGNNSTGDDRAATAPFWAPVLDLLSSEKRKKSSDKDSDKPAATATVSKPDWMKELENMEDETGLTCAVCQEGMKYKSSEMMGLYAYVKKVAISHGDSSNLDGTKMLANLPTKLPPSLEDSLTATEWYQSGKAAGDELKDSGTSGSSSSSSSRNRSNHYTTTVTAGNAIHMTCHSKARLADKNHPKAPKSEWEGAALRNLGVNCNVIFPLVSSRSSSVSLFSIEKALTEHQTAVANLIGVRPKSNLWNVLHDVRLMLLRVAYGESLDADCGGGSLGSNAQLIYHQLSMAKMFENEAQVDAPATSQHARNLSAGFLAACEIISAEDYDSSEKSSLIRGIADSSLMAALTCILFHNTKEDYGSVGEDAENCPHPKRRWVIGKELFLRGFLNCAGCRHALAINDSGCISTRNVGRKRSRSRSFAEWDIVNEDAGSTQESSPFTSRTTTQPPARKSMSPKINSARANIDDFGSALRPMIIYFAIMDQLSSDFAPNHDDEKIEECSNRLVGVIEACQKSKSIHELLEKAKITLSHEQIINELQRGMIAA